MPDLDARYGDQMKEFAESLIQFNTITGREGAELDAQHWFLDRLQEFGFETYTWEADIEALADHPCYPASHDQIIVKDRPNVGGVLEFGNPDDGPALILNGHMDVVDVNRALWDTDPFEPTWEGDRLIGRGAIDMKSAVTANVFVARYLHDEYHDDLDGRIVVESVTGEEDGATGSTAAALANPYPFDRDAAIVTEPTGQNLYTAIEGNLFLKLTVTGRSAHAGTRWEGESVLPHFEAIRKGFESLESERNERITHELYVDYPIAWPVNIGVVSAGSWPGTVPSQLEGELRIGFSPGESLEAVEAEFQTRLEQVMRESEWLSDHPPRLERYRVDLDSAEVAPNEPIVTCLQDALATFSLDPARKGATYGCDAVRYIVDGDIPAPVFGPGRIEQAHQPNEAIHWPDVIASGDILIKTARNFLSQT